MAVPKRKMSRSRTRSRRAQWKAEVPALIPVSVQGRVFLVPPRLTRAVRQGLIDLKAD